MDEERVEKLVYFIRHGESTQNFGNVFQGPDSVLTERGKKQAQFVADRTRSLGAEVVLTSPFIRARETAQTIVAATHLPLVEELLFREFSPPTSLIGKPRNTEEGRNYIRKLQANLTNPEWRYADEENYFDLHTRAITALQHLLERPEHKIIVVTHAAFMRALLTAMMTEGEPSGETMRQLMRFIKPMNTGITICRYRSWAVQRNKWRLLTWNDHSHLADTDLEDPKTYDLQ